MSGDYSVHDLHDLAAAWAYQVGQMQAAYKCAVANGWAYGAGNAAGDAWQDTYGLAFSTFGQTLDRANALVGAVQGNPLESWDLVSATDDQGDVVSALQQAFAPFIDLDRQVRAEGNPTGFPQSCLPSYPNVPQPTAPDWSLDAYKALGAITDTTDKLVGFLESPAGLLSLGVLVTVSVLGLVLVLRR